MTNSTSTLAVIVTHNRCRLLERCIKYIRRQSHKPDEIVVINNGSTDGTIELLQRLNIKVLTQDNLGSAGGWKRGLEYAMANNFDAAWLMDDDGYPDENALGLLMDQFDKAKACISSVVVQEDNPLKFVFPLPILNQNGLPIIWAWPRKIETLLKVDSKCDNNTYRFAHLFNGALISIDAVRSIGNVNEKFYIYGDEVDYFFRLRTYGEVISILNAYHYHPDVSKRPYSPAKIYYAIKNSLIINKKYYDSIFIRNIMSVSIVIVRTLKRNGIHWIYPLFFGKYRKTILMAIYKGLEGLIGRDFNE